jgi:hypothetical protein
MPATRWRPVPGFASYELHLDGSLRCLKHGRWPLDRPRPVKVRAINGVPCYALWAAGRPTTRTVASLMRQVFGELATKEA